MKRQDVVFALGIGVLSAPFFLLPGALSTYERLTADHAVLTSFVKFAVLATLGEVIALRIRKQVYHEPGFGLLPRALVWGVLGVGIWLAFGIFSNGAPAALRALGLGVTPEVMKGELCPLKVLGAFFVSLTMNSVFAPVMMTAHKVTDEHIIRHRGALLCLARPIEVGDILARMNWTVMWGFVFKKTLPLFWVPAHTVTFLLPPEHRVLFAAVLGVVLGVLLAIASLKARLDFPRPAPAA
jgi:hypothetical protein